jgi:allantoinase
LPNSRDLLGYGPNIPHANWPGKARIAVQFVLNYEEGGENSILMGDPTSECFLSEIIGAAPVPSQRHMNMESIYEYGSRSGFWRLHRLFSERNLPLTVFAVSTAMEQNPSAVEAMLKSNWEIASHGYRWIDYQFVPAAVEREHIQKSLDIHKRLTGSHPFGWYTGRTSPNTRNLVLQETQLLYDADSYADDLPYWIRDTPTGNPHLIVPYTLDANDMRFATAQGFNTGDHFYTYLKETFDTLYDEGEKAPKMMSVGLHCRLAGRPGRAHGVARFLDYVMNKDHVWVTRRCDIANHWKKIAPIPSLRK